MLVQAGLCQTCSETTLVFPGGGSFLEGFPVDSFSADINVYAQHHNHAIFRVEFWIQCIIANLHIVTFPFGSLGEKE